MSSIAGDDDDHWWWLIMWITRGRYQSSPKMSRWTSPHRLFWPHFWWWSVQWSSPRVPSFEPFPDILGPIKKMLLIHTNPGVLIYLTGLVAMVKHPSLESTLVMHIHPSNASPKDCVSEHPHCFKILLDMSQVSLFRPPKWLVCPFKGHSPNKKWISAFKRSLIFGGQQPSGSQPVIDLCFFAR